MVIGGSLDLAGAVEVTIHRRKGNLVDGRIAALSGCRVVNLATMGSVEGQETDLVFERTDLLQDGLVLRKKNRQRKG